MRTRGPDQEAARQTSLARGLCRPVCGGQPQHGRQQHAGHLAEQGGQAIAPCRGNALRPVQDRPAAAGQKGGEHGEGRVLIGVTDAVESDVKGRKLEGIAGLGELHTQLDQCVARTWQKIAERHVAAVVDERHENRARAGRAARGFEDGRAQSKGGGQMLPRRGVIPSGGGDNGTCAMRRNQRGIQSHGRRTVLLRKRVTAKDRIQRAKAGVCFLHVRVDFDSPEHPMLGLCHAAETRAEDAEIDAEAGAMGLLRQGLFPRVRGLRKPAQCAQRVAADLQGIRVTGVTLNRRIGGCQSRRGVSGIE